MRREKKVMNRGRAKSEGYNRKKIVAQVGINERRQLGRKFQEKKRHGFCCYCFCLFVVILFLLLPPYTGMEVKVPQDLGWDH